MAEALKDAPKKVGRAGHLCYDCKEPIDVLDMLILTVSGVWSIQDYDLPQLGGQLKFHPGCVPNFVKYWESEYGRAREMA